MAEPIRLNPAGVHAPVGAYSHAAVVPAGSQLLYIAGQVGMRPDGTLPSGFADQAEQAFANLVGVLKGTGFAPAHLVKLNIFAVAGHAAAEARAARVKHLGEIKPASTFVYVPALVGPEYLIEVEGVAAR